MGPAEESEPAGGLAEALERMHWRVEPGSFGLVGLPRRSPGHAGGDGPGHAPGHAGGDDPVRGLDLEALGEHAQVVLEPGEVTILATEAALEPVLARWPDARVERDLVWIRFLAPMGWEVVGFLARVSAALARAGVPIGAVCSYDRDHLFVRERYLDRARGALGELLPGRELR